MTKNGAHGRLTHDLHDETGYHTLEKITLLIAKLTQKTKDNKKLSFLIGNSNEKCTTITRFKRRDYDLSKNTITL